jgi:hypothetical protein
MFLYSNLFLIAIVLIFLGGSKNVSAMDFIQENEYLLSKQKHIKLERMSKDENIILEDKENEKTGNKITTQTQLSTSEKLTKRIDRLTKAFKDYEDLSQDDQKVLRDQWEAKVIRLDFAVDDFRIRTLFHPHLINPKQPIEKFEITTESLQNLRRIKKLYPEKQRSCCVF